MLLELGSQLLGKFFRVNILCLFVFNWISFNVNLYFFLLRRRWCDVEDPLCSRVAEWVPIKNVTSVLAIVLAESPPDSLVEKVSWNLLIFVLFQELVDLRFDLESNELIDIFSLIDSKQSHQPVIILLELILVVFNIGFTIFFFLLCVLVIWRWLISWNLIVDLVCFFSRVFIALIVAAHL